MNAAQWLAKAGFRQINTGELAGLWWHASTSEVAAIRTDGNVQRLGPLASLNWAKLDCTIDRALVAA